jgi:hypothetical protein
MATVSYTTPWDTIFQVCVAVRCTSPQPAAENCSQVPMQPGSASNAFTNSWTKL